MRQYVCASFRDAAGMNGIFICENGMSQVHFPKSGTIPIQETLLKDQILQC